MKISKNFTIILAILAAVAIVSGCESGVFGEKIKEGVITYHLDYQSDNNKSSLVMMMPSEMYLTFKDDKTALNVRGFAGCFVLRCICDEDKKTNVTTLTLGFKSYLLKSKLGDTPFQTSTMSDIKLTQTNDTSYICGYLCRKAVGHSEKCNRDFEFWFTEDIDIDSECLMSPVSSLSGVLMEFEMEMMGIDVKVKASEVKRADVPDETFDTPDDIDEVSREELDSIIHTFDTDGGSPF